MVPLSQTIHQLFDESADRQPDAVALVHPTNRGPERLSYAELRRRSGGIAATLRTAGIVPGNRVALLMERGPDLIAAMLGVLKTGGAYVPLDPALPLERAKYMVADTGARVCLTDAVNLSRVKELGVETPLLVTHLPDADDSTHVNPAAEAYVMYTSGSTGRPKGVVIPHRAVVRLVREQEYARLDDSRVLLQLAPITFDASTFEIWGALLNGGRCVLAPQTGIPDLNGLRELITTSGVTTLWLTASLFNTIIDHAPGTLASVAEVLTGGEALSVAHIRRAQQLLPAVQFVNGYGPTESTTFACCFRIPRPLPADWRSVPIGSAITRTTALVLDSALRPAAPGDPGELFIGGDGLAHGYLNQPALTAERFVESGTFGRLYRTGDRARLASDGWIEFLGRDDDQVKVRGYRIELGEIETALASVPGIARAVAAVREDAQGDRSIIAWYTTSDCRASLSGRALREHLARELPDYMIPSAFVQVDVIPLTPNGKADRSALPAASRARPPLNRTYVAPRSALEQRIGELWREILGLDAVGIHDRFFELGGTSMAAIRFLARLNEDTRAPIPALVLFRAPTIAELAIILEREYRNALPAPLAVSAAPHQRGPDRATQQQAELRERRLRRRRAP